MRRHEFVVARRRPDPRGGEARRQRLARAFAPLDILPGLGGQAHRKLFGRNRPMIGVVSQTRRLAPPAAPGFGRQWLFAGRPDRQRRLHAHRIGQPQRRDASAEGPVAAVAGVGQHGALATPSFRAASILASAIEYLELRNEIGAIFDDVEKHIGEQLTLEKAIAIVTQSVPDGQSKEISKIVHAQGLDQKSWSTFALSSSPKPMGDLIKKRSQGHKVRFMDIILPPRSAGGIIDNPPNGLDRVEFAKSTVREIEEIIASNYGHLFPRWIKLLLSTDLSDEILQLIDKFVLGVRGNESGYEQRFARKFGILYAAGNHGLLNWPEGWPAKAIAKCYRNAKAASRRDEVRVETAITRLQQAVTDGRFVSAMS